MGRVHDRLDLVVGHQRFGDVSSGSRDAAGDRDLDPGGSGADLAPYRFHELVGSVGGLTVGAVTRGDVDHLAGTVDAGSFHLAPFDRRL